MAYSFKILNTTITFLIDHIVSCIVPFNLLCILRPQIPEEVKFCHCSNVNILSHFRHIAEHGLSGTMLSQSQFLPYLLTPALCCSHLHTLR